MSCVSLYIGHCTGHWLCDLLIQTCLQLRQIGQITAFNSLTSSLNQRVHMCSFCETLKYINVKYFTNISNGYTQNYLQLGVKLLREWMVLPNTLRKH